MIEYEELIAEKKLIKTKYNLEMQKHKTKIKKYQEKKNRENQKKYFKFLMLLDILFVVGIACNFGALFLTNLMVVHHSGSHNLNFVEANPVQSELFQKADTNKFFMLFMIQCLKISIIIILYIIYRIRLYSEYYLWTVIIIAIMSFILFGLDFINNFGYYAGVWMF
jgi:magnesium-transporting ATPase (P-type)